MANEMFVHQYINNLNTFITFRLFASAYQNEDRMVYIQAVAELVNGFGQMSEQLVEAEIKRQKDNVKFDSRRFRLESKEALNAAMDYAKQYLLVLNPPKAEEKPPASEEKA